MTNGKQEVFGSFRLKEQHAKEIALHRVTLQGEIREREARMKILKNIEL
jgi:hypothetical protein